MTNASRSKKRATQVNSGEVDHALLDDLRQEVEARAPGNVRELVEALVTAIAEAEPSSSDFEAIRETFMAELASGDDFEALSNRLVTLKCQAAADIALHAAAVLDLEKEEYREIWGGPFNGQQGRQAMFAELVEKLGVTSIVETGTFRGSSTAFMAERSGLPVFSCEAHGRYYYYSKRRLKNFDAVQLSRSDSRGFLKRIFSENVLPAGPTLFYLDAHWYNDLPLWEELAIIFSTSDQCVVMIDDFRVPGDPGFSYDDYGPGRCLAIPDLRQNFATDADFFFPRLSSAAETGMKRGVVVVARGETAVAIARDVRSLERLGWREAVLLDRTEQAEIAASSAVEHMKAELVSLRTVNERLSRSEIELRAEVVAAESTIGQFEAEIRDLERKVAESAGKLAESERMLADSELKLAESEKISEEQRRLFVRVQSDLEVRLAASEQAKEELVRSLETLSRAVRDLRKSPWWKLGINLRIARETPLKTAPLS